MYNPAGGLANTQNPGSTGGAKAYADKVDLNDLDWEDRERVLRLLFSKINQGTNPASNWKQGQNMGEIATQDEHNAYEDEYEAKNSENALSIKEHGEEEDES